MSSLLRSSKALSLFMACCFPTIHSVFAEGTLAVGDKLENFTLQTASGVEISLVEANRQPVGTVLAFLSSRCPIATVHAPRLVDLEIMYRGEDIRFLAIDPDTTSSQEALAFAKTAGIEFPLLRDPFHALTDRFGVERTTEVFLLDKDFHLIYRGALDDQFAAGDEKDSPSEEYLALAIEALISGEEIETSRTQAQGSPLGGLDTTGGDPRVTFHRDIAPILYANCVECHREGQIGPMALFDYEDVKGWGPTIVEVIDQGRMPPWHANAGYGVFSNHRRINDTQKAMIRHWVNAGAPEGDSAQAPQRPTFDDDGWAIGSPDHIIELAEPEEIPATGTIPYRYVLVDPKIDEDRWVQAMEIRPTAPHVTHHVLVLLIPKGQDWRTTARGSGRGFIDRGYFAVNVPGARPNIYPQGTAKFFPAGSKLLFQLHYTANGESSVDRTRMAFRWATAAVEKEVKTTGIANASLDIPPGEMATYTAKTTIEKPMRLVSMFPHMHTRGHAFRVEVVSGEETEIVLDVPKYDFNWQNFYRLESPKLLGIGDQIVCTATFDNTEENPFNPNPKKRVRWGDQTWEEMMIGYIDYIELD